MFKLDMKHQTPEVKCFQLLSKMGVGVGWRDRTLPSQGKVFHSLKAATKKVCFPVPFKGTTKGDETEEGLAMGSMGSMGISGDNLMQWLPSYERRANMWTLSSEKGGVQVPLWMGCFGSIKTGVMGKQ